jgi:hypothetical protein
MAIIRGKNLMQVHFLIPVFVGRVSLNRYCNLQCLFEPNQRTKSMEVMYFSKVTFQDTSILNEGSNY